MRPEFSKLIIGILLIGVDLGAYYYVENRRREKRVKALLDENSRRRLESQRMQEALSSKEDELFLHFKADRRIVSVDVRKIVYVESMSEYVKIHLTDADEPVMVLFSLKKLIEQLPADRFMRIHRSYIIALNHMTGQWHRTHRGRTIPPRILGVPGVSPALSVIEPDGEGVREAFHHTYFIKY